MQMKPAQTNEFTGQATEHSFSSVWGNEMQREDFLALAVSVRQFSASQTDTVFVSDTLHSLAEETRLAAQ